MSQNEDGRFRYYVIVQPSGDTIVRVADRGQHLCEKVYTEVIAGLGTITKDLETPEGDCPPVRNIAQAGN